MERIKYRFEWGRKMDKLKKALENAIEKADPINLSLAKDEIGKLITIFKGEK